VGGRGQSPYPHDVIGATVKRRNAVATTFTSAAGVVPSKNHASLERGHEAHLGRRPHRFTVMPVPGQDEHHWPWSSAKAHLGGVPDPLLDDAPLLAIVADWR
jgi:hypothetical protein